MVSISHSRTNLTVLIPTFVIERFTQNLKTKDKSFEDFCFGLWLFKSTGSNFQIILDKLAHC